MNPNPRSLSGSWWHGAALTTAHSRGRAAARANRFQGVQQREEARALHAEKGRKAARRIAKDQKRRRKEDRDRRRRAGEDVSSSSSAGDVGEDTETDTSVTSPRLDAEFPDLPPRMEGTSSPRRPVTSSLPRGGIQDPAGSSLAGSSQRQPVMYTLSEGDGGQSSGRPDLDAASSEERASDPVDGSGRSAGAAGADP